MIFDFLKNKPNTLKGIVEFSTEKRCIKNVKRVIFYVLSIDFYMFYLYNIIIYFFLYMIYNNINLKIDLNTHFGKKLSFRVVFYISLDMSRKIQNIKRKVGESVQIRIDKVYGSMVRHRLLKAIYKYIYNDADKKRIIRGYKKLNTAHNRFYIRLPYRDSKYRQGKIYFKNFKNKNLPFYSDKVQMEYFIGMYLLLYILVYLRKNWKLKIQLNLKEIMECFEVHKQLIERESYLRVYMKVAYYYAIKCLVEDGYVTAEGLPDDPLDIDIKSEYNLATSKFRQKIVIDLDADNKLVVNGFQKHKKHLTDYFIDVAAVLDILSIHSFSNKTYDSVYKLSYVMRFRLLRFYCSCNYLAVYRPKYVNRDSDVLKRSIILSFKELTTDFAYLNQREREDMIDMLVYINLIICEKKAMNYITDIRLTPKYRYILAIATEYNSSFEVNTLKEHLDEFNDEVYDKYRHLIKPYKELARDVYTAEYGKVSRKVDRELKYLRKVEENFEEERMRRQKELFMQRVENLRRSEC